MINKILINREERQLKILTILLFFLLIAAVFVTAQNLTESQSDDEVTDLCENVECEDSSTECPDGFIASCSNTCDSETGECSQCNPDCAGQGIILPEEPSNETTPTIPKENITIPINETNQTAPEIPLPEDTNETSNETILEPEPTPEPSPELDIQIFHPFKITRGEIIEIKATITNSGAKAKDVLATWELPERFEIISGSQEENCGNLNTGDSCISTIDIQTSYSTSLGENQIKIMVSYEK